MSGGWERSYPVEFLSIDINTFLAATTYNGKEYNIWSGCQKDFQELPTEGQTSNRIFRNQNRLFNQIHYSIGTMNTFNTETKSKLKKDQLASFRKDINAFVYKYEPDWWNEIDPKIDPRLPPKSTQD